MANIVNIIPTDDQIKCMAGESCSVDFSFTNTTGRKIRVGGKVLPGDKGQEQWFKPKGGPEWDLDPNATDKLTVMALVPKDVKPGTHTLQVMIFDVRQPEDYFDMSPPVRIEVGAAVVPPPPPPNGFPWWILATVLGVLVVAGLAAYLILWPQNVSVPAVVGMKADQAKAVLQDASLTVSQIDEPSTSPIGLVISQDPEKDAEVKKDSQVVIHVAAAKAKVTADVPNLVRVPFPDAERILGTLNLKAVRKEPPKATLEFQPGQVATQNPGFPSQVEPGSIVELEVAGPSVQVPRVKGQTLPAAMEAMAKAQLFVEVTGDQSKLQEAVTGTSPAEDTVVLQGSKVKIHMPGNVLIFIPPERIRLNPIFLPKQLQIMRKVMPEGETTKQEHK